METVTTPRLVLRPFCKGDLVAFYEYSRDAAVGPQAGWRQHGSLEESRMVLQELMRLDEIWGIELKAAGRIVGSIGLHEDKRRPRPGAKMMGYVLGSAHWGQGYATEAARAVLRHGFTVQRLAMITAYLYPGNSRSARVVEKCGFVYEGRLRNASILPNGQASDELCYSLTAEEFYSQD